MQTLLKKIRTTGSRLFEDEEVKINDYTVFLTIKKDYSTRTCSGGEPDERLEEVVTDQIEVIDYMVYDTEGDMVNSYDVRDGVGQIIDEIIVKPYNLNL